jgi:hypothetical protein
VSELAAQQAALVRALVAGGPCPDGFDADRVRRAGDALLRKRARGVAGHWPALGAMPDFSARFAQWAQGRAPGSGHDEGIAFAAELGAALSPAAKVEQVLAGHGRVAREAGVVVVRWPLLGVRRMRYAPR